MTKAEAEYAIRLLADAYGDEPWRMSDADADRLAEAIAVLGQARVFRIAEAHAQRTPGTTGTVRPT